MANWIITKNKEYFKKIKNYNFCNLEDIILPEVIGIDSETTGLKARHETMFCIQISSGNDNYIIDFYTSEDAYTFKNIIPYIKNKTLIGHNLTFDLGFFYKHNFYPEKVFDTMIASKILYNGMFEGKQPFKHDFGSVMKRELNIIYDKTDQKNINVVKLSQASTIKYSFNDVDRLIELHNVMLGKLKYNKQLPTYKLHCNFIKALAYIEQCGLAISSQKWKEKMLVDLKNQQNYATQVKEYIWNNISKFRDGQLCMFDDCKGLTIQITSPLQMISIFRELGINTKDKDGRESIGENIISKSKHEFVKLWLKFQEANHRVTTFGNKIYQQIENERIYTNFNPMVDTARLSSRKGAINFLNFPSDKITRDSFTCKKENVIIVCDWAGQETVISADFTKDEAMTKSVIEGADLHCLLARELFPEIKLLTDEEIIKKHKDKRQASKSPRFAMAYGGNAFTIHQNEGIPYNEALKIENSFKELHKGLYEWGKLEYEKAIKVGYITSVDGWKLALPQFDLFAKYKKNVSNITKEQWKQYKNGKQEAKNLLENNKYKIVLVNDYNFYKNKKKQVQQYFKLKSQYERLCLNSPIQTCGSHMIKKAAVMLFDWIVENNYQNKVLISNLVHDEIVLETSQKLAKIIKLKLEECMIKAGNYYLTNLTIKAEANLGSSWSKAK